MADCSDYAALFLNDIPLIDTRAPVEFHKGAFAHSVNLPLMTDSERAAVGTCYKQHGQEAAIELGHRLVAGEVKQQRVQQWREFAQQHPSGMLYCFRGGLRSRISQQWLSEAGVDYPRVAGGYKALRTFLLTTLEQAVQECQFTLLSGLTGTGKTDLLVQLQQGLDLEGLANHRGSSFGKHATLQPSQINFENNIAVDILKKRHAGIGHFVLENEGRLVGACNLPICLLQPMKNAPMVILTDTLEQRVDRILRDYVINLRREFVDLHGAEQGDITYSERLLQSLKNISKRLGGERYQRLNDIMQQALQQQLAHGDVADHRAWIQTLLEEYYDPMYHYQHQQTAARHVFQGNFEEVLGYLTAVAANA